MSSFASDVRTRLEVAANGIQIPDNRTRRSLTHFLLCYLVDSIQIAEANPSRDDYVDGSSACYSVMEYMAMLARSILPSKFKDVLNYLKRELSLPPFELRQPL